MAKRPLEGVKVLEAGQLIAIPMAGSIMGDFGAEVIKIEMPGTGDDMRRLGRYKDVSLSFKVMGRNKKCITLDLRRPRGQDLFKKLVARTDVLLENFRAGTLERWGIGWDVLKEVNPKLIMARGTGFGQTGPYAERASFGYIVEAFAGVPNSIGYSDVPPVLSTLADPTAALMATYGVMFALYHRDVHGGPGQVVDNAAAEAMLRIVSGDTVPSSVLGLPARAKPPSTQPSRAAKMGDLRCNGVFPTGDGKWVTFTPSTWSTWVRLMKAMGREDYLDEASYPPGSEARAQRSEEIHAAVRGYFAGYTRTDLVSLMERHEIPIGPVYDTTDILEDPHFRDRQVHIDVPDPDLGSIKMVTALPRLSETPGAIEHTGPGIGEHNSEVFGGVLGLSGEELEELKTDGVI